MSTHEIEELKTWAQKHAITYEQMTALNNYYQLKKAKHGGCKEQTGDIVRFHFEC